MAVVLKPDVKSLVADKEGEAMAFIEQHLEALFVDKRAVRQMVAELNARMGFVPDPTATPEKVREMMRADGIRAEDNVFSGELMRMRYDED